MPSEHQNFELTQGVDKDLVFTVSDNAGDAVDITGATIFWKLYADDVNGDTKVSKGSDSIGGVVITTALSGIFTVTLADTDTVLLSGTFFHEAKVVDSSGNISLVSRGWVFIKVANLT